MTEHGSNGHSAAMDDGPAAARRIGDLIVDRGLISREQLEDALLEQQASRKRLGTILVSNGAITPPDLTEALVSQIHGRTGMGLELEDDGLDAGELDEDNSSPKRRRRIFRRRRARAAVPETPAITEDDLLLLLRELEIVAAELGTVRREIAARDARIAELESSLHARQRERALVADALETEIRDLGSSLEAARLAARVVDEGTEEPEEPTTSDESRDLDAVARADGYVVFVPTMEGGHELRELLGHPPAVGSEIELDGRRFLVVSHRRSPLSFDGRTCAYLRAT